MGLFATLRATPGGPPVLDDARLFPPALRPLAQSHAEGVAHLRRSGTHWLVLAPPAGLSPDAPDTGRYELGDDIVDEKRKDRPVAYEDLARAVLDQIDRPTRHRSLIALYGA